MTGIIAHRGNAAHAPENTLAAFESAIEAGADRIELDVQLSADGTPFVFHDIQLERLTGLRDVACSYKMRDLAKLHVAANAFPATEDTLIPTFKRVVERVGGRIPLYVEIKVDGAGRQADAWKKLTDAVLDLLPADQGHVVASFDLRVVRRCLRSGAPTVLIASDPRRLGELTPREIQDLEAYSVIHERIDARVVHTCDAASLDLWAWTVDSPGDFERLRTLGAGSAWCTNDVPALRAWLRERDG